MLWWSGRRGSALIVVPVGLLLLAGCTSGTPGPADTSTPPPVATPTPTPTASPSPTPTVDVTVKPTRPAAMDQPPSVEGAVAVAEYFQLLFPYVFATGDLTEWKTLSHPDCLYCSGVIADVDEMFGWSLRTEGGEFTISDSSGSEVDPGAWYSATIRLTQAPSRTVNLQGTVVEDFPDTKTGSVDIAVVWEAGAWKIREATPRADGGV